MIILIISMLILLFEVIVLWLIWKEKKLGEKENK
jgi:hypothetical protein